MYFVSALLVLVLVLSSFSQVKVASPDQALHLRRISEYWKEGDYTAAKGQILSFLSHYEKSDLRDHLYAMLGDIYFLENQYKDAVAAYDQVTTKEFKKRILLHRLQALFSMQEYIPLIRNVTEHFKEGSEIKEEETLRFLLAESLWRHGMKIESKEKRALFLEQAQVEYVFLEKTRYKEDCLLPLAEINKELKRYPQAASLFLALAKKESEKKEEFLFQAGCMQQYFDNTKAAETFRTVYEMKGKRAPIAAYNQMLLLFQNDKFRELVAAKDQALKEIPQEKLPLLNFFIGKSYYALGNHKEAVAPLEFFVREKRQATPECQAALLSLLHCAQALNDRPLLERAMQNLFALFPQDSASPYALMLHAELSEKLTDTAAAQADLKRVVQEFPAFQERERAFFERGRLFYVAKEWENCRKTFLDFLKEFPESSRLLSSLRYIYNSSTQELKGATTPKKEELLSSVTLLVQQENREEYRLLYAQLLQECGRDTDAFMELSRFVQDFPASPSLGHVYLMLALSSKSDPLSFLTHADKALERGTDDKTKGWVLVEMYNACLKLAQEKDNKCASWMEKGADYLFSSLSLPGVSTRPENLVWLSDFYYQRAKQDPASKEGERAALLLQKLLGVEKSFADLSITDENLSLESEVLKFADLLSCQKRAKEAATLLEALAQQQKKKPDLSWKFQRRTLLELARAYTADKNSEKAIQSYDQLITSAPLVPSLLADEALLEKAKLEYSLLSKEEKSEKNPKIFKILDNLKDLQIKKRLVSEPLHLEAALEYIAIKVDLAPTDARTEKALHLFKQMREDFFSEEDLLAQDYHALRSRFPEKERLFQNYMKFVDATVMHLESEMCEEKEAPPLKKQAVKMLEEMQQQSQLTPTLKKKIADTLEEVTKKHA